MNLKCKAIFHINIVSFWIIHVAIEFSDNHVEKYGLVLKNSELIMDL
jgi:hypothetical protein